MYNKKSPIYLHAHLRRKEEGDVSILEVNITGTDIWVDISQHEQALESLQNDDFVSGGLWKKFAPEFDDGYEHALINLRD